MREFLVRCAQVSQPCRLLEGVDEDKDVVHSNSDDHEYGDHVQ